MITIVHRIRLRPGVSPADFERWVVEVDYAAGPRVPSVVSFAVHRVEGGDYFEVIGLESLAAFEKDMQGEVFQGLVKDFDRMAEVVDELAGERLGDGYARV